MTMRAKVLTFDENRGWGTVRLKDGRILRFTHKDVKDEGFVILFEGEWVEVELEENNRIKWVKRIQDD